MATPQRYFIQLSYNGTNYHGWQVQKNAVSVQAVINEKLSVILRQPIDTTGCGRTDTGVHAKDFFAHFDAGESMVDGPWSLEKKDSLLRSINAILPVDIAAMNLFPVAADANARFDAKLRTYEYHIHFNKDPFKNNYSWELRDRPDLELMNKAAQLMMAYTDFSCFSKSNTQVKTNNCKITYARWEETESGIVFRISADRFLRNMVRAIVGTLIMVGRKEIEPEAMQKIIESKNRSNAGTSVPACGLYLTEVKY
ncbi:tRNA pseudouridine(38-40) synthase TruA [uncultured Mucilaginibacter sp.]|uniref:tRNA pseudouridine(38-40) synthase TruA n=1 Tax=uncultured Mucilaginibacter sp. TaxID=797541 RepID=UPI0025F5EBB4|nr:tRNA pseudouridine(38-40) synthase TruA [uncultured Mucilaginibacter sp.]